MGEPGSRHGLCKAARAGVPWAGVLAPCDTPILSGSQRSQGEKEASEPMEARRGREALGAGKRGGGLGV
jgi:hypothetical protein